ncbi:MULTISPECIES: glycerophosphodiester phosphodiesterase [unclassified Rhizobium]|uniref:glycerophosphodiester phosphodiesterase n=1 Tax=unclassified Rhizobium TaxID=2613769 RepID=UPI0016104BE5|nr:MULTISPECIES: glycerophosphodiester phosphodiesterase [unclassified Rhizobium]MBB3288895.1 glycerophosphoryl diester phosphodiesterase [Rhizobium sp. BK252]MBB3403637.1 glycerophosphoryl diester phosphodiesterase [Rhizobium sp. BK289]MBB3416178.1 glycerophosphoryl diester phosphodiesterase [Rhizobium sp. BK284]MBB3484100.1 glycerophosphoryl diester phosphodiesterase [Rhizobium sp. BK347]MDK4720235.1 glycerophosphodiester phosphodiesterase [Rhizobium sp. CNPSo 3968]
MNKLAWLTERPVAHRGYHDMNKEVWENTLSAFSRAIEAGFAIECDLHYASDGVPVVFHDDDLQRVCNLPGEVRERTSAELGLLSVGGTKDKIPTLKQLLRLCDGKVPLVLELKGREGDDEGFAESVLEVLEGYKGHVALMSFDHWLLKDLKALEAPYPVGLTAEGNKPETFFQHDEAMHLGLDFISYFYGHLPNPFVTAQRQRGIPVITWTVRDEAARKHTFANADQMTFEGFDPRLAS